MIVTVLPFIGIAAECGVQVEAWKLTGGVSDGACGNGAASDAIHLHRNWVLMFPTAYASSCKGAVQRDSRR